MLQYTKDPDELLDYGWDWAAENDQRGPWLSTGDTITDSEWTFTGPDAALTIASADHSTTVTRVWLSGGTPGEEYVVSNVAPTAQGRSPKRSFIVRIDDR
jgi:hypothetical protein